jgi:hypothetical protein
LDDRSLDFWLNGARIIAYDFPTWSATEETRDLGSTERRVRRYAESAIAFLDRGLERHPHSSALWVERANLQLNKLRDISGAAEGYLRASMQPDAPYYAARIHAELLRKLGRKAEALQFLRALYPTLPHQSQAAAAPMILERIRSLETELRGGAVSDRPAFGARISDRSLTAPPSDE